LLQLDGKVIDVLGLHDATDRDVQRNGLSLLEFCVRLTLGYLWQVTDGEHAQVTNAAQRADSDGMNAELAISGRGNRGLQRVVLLSLELLHREARRVKQKFFHRRQTAAGDRESRLRAALDSVRRERVDLRIAGKRGSDE